jgi:hypothetical protein
MREFITPLTIEMLVRGPRRVTSKSESSLRTGGGAFRAPWIVIVKRKRSSTCPDLGDISEFTDTSAIPTEAVMRNKIVVRSEISARGATIMRCLTAFIGNESPWIYYQ